MSEKSTALPPSYDTVIKEKTSAMGLPWAVLKPQGERRERKLEVVDTVLAWLTVWALIMPILANEYMYFWIDDKGVKWPTHGVFSAEARAAVHGQTRQRRADLPTTASVEAMYWGDRAWISNLVYAVLVALTGSWFAYKLHKARNPAQGQPDRSLKTLRQKRRFIPCVLAILMLPIWALLCYAISTVGYQPGPVLWVACVGLITNIFWIIVRVIRKRAAGKALEQAKGRAQVLEPIAHSSGARFA
ncbi:hypothetical protein QFC20_003622 [Naganishia adeliensis]|uniref:Uncharacterized protein n=1 Tax=Naganishia adeliensis TaxID=92952 RepID=A0ACC2W8I6_9TREE|nr:hypothetical protein QFC20_003622 [Naganishia adeliensis]